MLWYVIASNLFALCLFLYRHYIWRKWMIQTSPEGVKPVDLIGKASSYGSFGFNILLLIVSPIPGMAEYVKIEDVHYVGENNMIGDTYYLEDFLTAFMLLRLWFLFQRRYNNSIYREPHTKNLCLRHNFYPHNWFIMKVNLLRKPEKTIAFLFILSVIVFSQMILIFEYQNFIEDEN